MSRRERKRQRQSHRGHPVKRVIGFAILFAVCGLAMAALFAAGWVVSVADSAPNLSQLTPHEPHPPTAVYAANGELLGYIHSDNLYIPVTGAQIPTVVRQATVAIEDRRFWQHGPLDYQGIIRAGLKDVFGGGGSLQGASTLTMQLVNNRYLDGTKYAQDHDLKYKIIQAKLAEQLGARHSKTWILDSYLNIVPYGTVGGETALGVGAASEMFFDKPVGRLDLAQAALLAGLPQAPSDYNPFIDRAKALARRTAVLQAMVNSRYITAAPAAAANAEPLEVHPGTAYTTIREPYLFDYIQQQLIQRFGLQTVQNGGLKVYTTLDLNREREAEDAVVSHEGGPILDNQPAAALASIDASNGHILALASSATYNQTKFFYPVDAERQTGSAFKVFALMTLIHDYDGDPSQTYYTSKFLPAGWLPQDPTWSVHTAEETYQGTIDVTKATTVSDNTVFAQLAADLGWDKLDQTAHKMGITSRLTGNPAEVIGGLLDCCTMLEMADAYATLANGGVHISPTILNRVVFPDGSAVNLGDPPHTRVFTDGEAYAATKVLETVIQSGTGTAANYGCPAAGKTGTAENLDNAWFVGYNPRISTAVWVGYPQGNIPMGDGFGGTLAAPIWNQYMQAAANGYCGDFAPPTDPWSGIPFVGPHSALGPASKKIGAGSGNATGNNTGAAPNNPTPFAQPPAQPAAPQGGPPQAGNGGGGGGPSGGGSPGGHGGGGHKKH
jgi:penicillin-binding protein 1A